MENKRVVAGTAALLMMITPGMTKGTEIEIVSQQESPEIGTGKHTIFANLPEEKKMLPVSAGELTYIEQKVNGVIEIVPCRIETVAVKQLEQMQMPESFRDFPGLEDCYVDMSMIPEDLVANGGYVSIFRDIVDGAIIGYLDNYGNFFGYENQFQNGEKVEYIDRFSANSLLALFKIDIKNNEYGITVETLREDTSLENFRKIFKQIVPREYWPIQNKIKKYENTTMPELTEEELNRKIDKDCFEVFMFFPNKYTGKPRKFCFAESVYEDTEARKEGIYDFVSGKYVSDLKGDNVDEEYEKELNPDNEKGDFGYNGYLGLIEKDEFSYLLEWFENIETVGDVIEAYQMLKPENQIDYSFLKDKKSRRGNNGFVFCKGTARYYFDPTGRIFDITASSEEESEKVKIL